MASIFTFNENPPRVSSPWSRATPPPDKLLHAAPTQYAPIACPIPIAKKKDGDDTYTSAKIDYSAITRLEAEPQEGPTEYKLHLLLRRRRSFTSSNTGRHLSGALRRSDSSTAGNKVVQNLLSSTPPPSAPTQSRQHRLEQLTTQLLWRLQQSCPHHSNSSISGVQLQFPDEASITNHLTPQRLYPGLEESKGALYEIGVADDGELIGLAEDEMEESLNNLRAMASSLGCQVDVVRMVVVGQCEWTESGAARKSDLVVAEAYVRPDLHLMKPDQHSNSNLGTHPPSHPSLPQLRVSLTGTTMSGKSSLLGTLSTGTLDNGRGKSRLSLLKHRHEIESGVTSSITQELIGYGDLFDPEGDKASSQVINYGCTDISSWTDIHTSAESLTAGRLVFLTDSAGHPRFRRTTVRGLVGWDPHYTLLCISAGNAEDEAVEQSTHSGLKESTFPPITEMDMSGELLRLCLSLDLPLIIVVTKYDLAKKASLKSILTRVLSALKGAGRTGRIVADPSTSLNSGIDILSPTDLLEAEATAETFERSPLATVPIVLTSALNGTGLRKLHALLRTLPIPRDPPAQSSMARGPLFHIEDVYASHSGRSASEKPLIVGGLLRYGDLNVGDELVLGPYPVDASSDDSDSGSARPSIRSSGQTSSSFPGALQKRPTPSVHAHASSSSLFEWRAVRITSLRTLRLPVPTLHSGQVGTVGLVALRAPIYSPAITRIRKGMVLHDSHSDAHKIIAVEFEGLQAESAKALVIGSAAVVFFASVRAPSKVLSVTLSSMSNENACPKTSGNSGADVDREGFGFDFGFEEDSGSDPANESIPSTTIVRFQFMGSREYVENGAKVLIMPGGSRPGLSGSVEKGEKSVVGLEGFVGRVVEGDDV